MFRVLAPLTVAGLLLSSCGPDHRRCVGAVGPHPDFVVVLKLSDRSLPPDTMVKVMYAGSGTETYDLAAPSADPEVVFCSPSTPSCSDPVELSGAAGAAGSGADDAAVEALRCELWTGGFATVKVEGTGLSDTSYPLSPDDKLCTVSHCIVLDSPDGG
ncbi:MAG TPA: hypothetical protein VIK01_19300 [Polyangiaceae bacterium]